MGIKHIKNEKIQYAFLVVSILINIVGCTVYIIDLFSEETKFFYYDKIIFNLFWYVYLYSIIVTVFINVLIIGAINKINKYYLINISVCAFIISYLLPIVSITYNNTRTNLGNLLFSAYTYYNEIPIIVVFRFLIESIIMIVFLYRFCTNRKKLIVSILLANTIVSLGCIFNII